ncbi:hypothetical protein [Nostoc sp. FACHB-152]|uniref:hypothetical protein n=1 Tax=Nostoc sp. FACHB-152 TaxID=2692837 RepID=UPI001F54AE10|nr:hypothetical protein [Nostoc sp. FACHB-152]
MALLLAGIYLLGQNIYFTTNIYPYWWRGVAADASILFLTSGILMLFVLSRQDKALGWVALGVGILKSLF